MNCADLTPALSIVLPCYNEARSLAELLDRFNQVFADQPVEWILVDNGSTDETPQTLAQLLPAYPQARSIRIDTNRGYGHGIHTGLGHARGRTLAWSHADLQTDPADIEKAWQVYQQADNPHLLVKGRRHGRLFAERFVSCAMQWVALILLRRWIVEINAQPKIFDRSLMDHLTDPPDDFNYDLFVLYRALGAGWQISLIDVRFPPRKYGVSHWAGSWRSRLRTIGRSIRFMARLGFSS